MNNERIPIVLVGSFPPPVHGMAAVNEAVRDALQEAGGEPRVINLAAPTLSRSLIARLGRLPRVLGGLATLSGARRLRGGTFYMSVSGGLGQAYEVLFVLLARLRGMKVFLHHHSYAYLNRPSYLTALLVRAAGCGAVHIVLSPRMAEQFGSRYPFGHTLPLSNSAILLCRDFDKARPRRCLQTLGFISNIAAEKGVFEFLDLLEELQELGLSLRGKLAGPCQDAKVEGILRERLASLQNIDYVGPKYGKEKDAFFASIDLLVFPTRYNNEAEPLTVHEAMSRGVPVIAYGRGAIPEIVGSDSGQIIAPSESFVTLAIDQIKMWVDKPILYESVSRSAIRQFSVTYSQNEKRWQCLLNRLMFGNRDSA